MVVSSNAARVTKKTIGEEGNRKRPHKIHFCRENSKAIVSSFSKSSMQRGEVMGVISGNLHSHHVLSGINRPFNFTTRSHPCC